MIHVAVDAMTSERGLGVVFEGARQALRELPDLALTLVGDLSRMQAEEARGGKDERLKLYPATQVIEMDEEPGQAFKAKKDASVSVTLRLLAEGKVDAAVSPGNTGASVIAATLTLGRLPGIRRPGILVLMPRRDGYTSVLDVGAVVDCKPEDLALFGVMGSLYGEAILKTNQPRVGLLSIGEEDIKGSEQSLAAFALLKKAAVRFVGNVEGRDLFNGRCDVVVCDGFVGNIVLKTAEGLATLIFDELKKSFQRGSFVTKVSGYFAKAAFRDFRKRMNADEYGGAVLLGVNGNFIIAHGSANNVAIKNAIRRAYLCVQEQLIPKLNGKIQQYNEAAS